MKWIIIILILVLETAVFSIEIILDKEYLEERIKESLNYKNELLEFNSLELKRKEYLYSYIPGISLETNGFADYSGEKNIFSGYSITPKAELNYMIPGSGKINLTGLLPYSIQVSNNNLDTYHNLSAVCSLNYSQLLYFSKNSDPYKNYISHLRKYLLDSNYNSLLVKQKLSIVENEIFTAYIQCINRKDMVNYYKSLIELIKKKLNKYEELLKIGDIKEDERNDWELKLLENELLLKEQERKFNSAKMLLCSMLEINPENELVFIYKPETDINDNLINDFEKSFIAHNSQYEIDNERISQAVSLFSDSISLNFGFKTVLKTGIEKDFYSSINSLFNNSSMDIQFSAGVYLPIDGLIYKIRKEKIADNSIRIVQNKYVVNKEEYFKENQELINSFDNFNEKKRIMLKKSEILSKKKERYKELYKNGIVNEIDLFEIENEYMENDLNINITKREQYLVFMKNRSIHK